MFRWLVEASWAFFADRIPYEEATLTAFYPDAYPAYRARTLVLIPFIPKDFGE